MPLYEYKCRDCGKKIVLLQKKIHDRADQPCPDCGGKVMDRVFSTFSMGQKRSPDAKAEAPSPEGAMPARMPEFRQLMVTNNPENLK